MKFNVEIEIDWIGEDNSLDEEIQKQITDSIVRAVKEKSLQECQKQVDAVLINTIDKEVNKMAKQMIRNFMSKKYVITDRYGDIQSETTMKKHLLERFEDFWNTTVNEKGDADSSYGNKRKRIQWIIDEQIKKHSKKFAETLADDTEKKIRTLMHDSVKEKIGEKFCTEIGLDTLIKNQNKKLPF